MTNEEKAYMAGIIDGEGSISVNQQTQKGHKYNYLRVEVANSNPVLAPYMKRITGYGSIYIMKHLNPEWKDRINWAVFGFNAGNLLSDILPYLIVKKKQAEYGLKLREANEKRDVRGAKEIGDELRKMNKKGKVKE